MHLADSYQKFTNYIELNINIKIIYAKNALNCHYTMLVASKWCFIGSYYINDE